MSRNFQSKNKDLVKLKVITADQAWDKTVKRKGKPTLSKQYDFFGRIDKGTSAFITSTNLIGENHKFVEDTVKLPKNLKNFLLSFQSLKCIMNISGIFSIRKNTSSTKKVSCF